MSWRILCESTELAVHCLRAAEEIGFIAAPRVEGDLGQAALVAVGAGEDVAIVASTTPSLQHAVELAHAALATSARIVLALPVPDPRRRVLIDVAHDLGIVALTDSQALVAVLALLTADAADAHAASARALSGFDRGRVRHALSTHTKQGGYLVPVNSTDIAWTRELGGTRIVLGDARDAAAALLGLRATQHDRRPVTSSVEGVDPRAVLDVIFGPRRALSDPTSKAALAPYGIPMPVEELCASPSRAAAEATRMGYPVRISLASPDLRVWDHPDLSVDMVDNAARVRDTFRQLLAAAESRLTVHEQSSRASEARVLGVMVTATSEALALLGIRASSLPHGRVAMELGFADPHGRASEDHTTTVLPAEPEAIERAVRRLAGASLVLGTTSAQRKARLDALCDVMLRLAAFVSDHAREIESVELRPVAILLDGTVEVREACVSVGDCFERSLDRASGT